MSKKVENKEKNYKDLIADEAVKLLKEGKIKTGNDAMDFLDGLLQPILQKLLDTELAQHLDYSKYDHKAKKDNYRNGYCKTKKVKTKYGEININTPRDREGTFEPKIIPKGQNKFTGFEDKCISLYAKGMSVRDIENTLKDIYGVTINKDQVSMFISAISEEVEKWQNRKLDPLYIFTYCDCLYIPIKEDLKSEKRAVYVVIGVNVNGMKDILGIWIDDTESASFWGNVFEDLKSRGVKDVLYMTSDGVAGFKNSLEIAFPKTQPQRCVVHLVRNIYKLCPKKEAKEIIKDYKGIYTSASMEKAEALLEDFKEKYSKYPNVVKKAKDFMPYLEPLFELPAEIRQAIYTSNAIESVNSALRKVTKGKGAFPSKEAVTKVLYLRIKDLLTKWTKPIKDFNKIQKQLILLFGERYTKYLKI